MTQMVPMTLSAHTIHECKLRGSCESTTSMSFEKRFMMRPIGVLSKNDIGARSPLFRIEVCSRVAERSRPSARANAEHRTPIPVSVTHQTHCVIRKTPVKEKTCPSHHLCAHSLEPILILAVSAFAIVQQLLHPTLSRRHYGSGSSVLQTSSPQECTNTSQHQRRVMHWLTGLASIRHHHCLL